MITRKGSKAYEAGLICVPNLDTLIPNARRNARIFRLCEVIEYGEDYSEVRLCNLPSKKESLNIKKKFDW